MSSLFVCHNLMVERTSGIYSLEERNQDALRLRSSRSRFTRVRGR